MLEKWVYGLLMIIVSFVIYSGADTRLASVSDGCSNLRGAWNINVYGWLDVGHKSWFQEYHHVDLGRPRTRVVELDTLLCRAC